MIDITSNMLIDLTGASTADRFADCLYIDPKSFRFDVGEFIELFRADIAASGMTPYEAAFKIGQCFGSTHSDLPGSGRIFFNDGKGLSIDYILNKLRWISQIEKDLSVWKKDRNNAAWNCNWNCKVWNLSMPYHEIIQTTIDPNAKKPGYLAAKVDDWDQLEAVPVSDIAKVVAYSLAQAVVMEFPRFHIIHSEKPQAQNAFDSYEIAKLIDARFYMKISTWPNASVFDKEYFAGFNRPVAEGFLEANVSNLLNEAWHLEREVDNPNEAKLSYTDRYGFFHERKNYSPDAGEVKYVF